MKKLLVSLLVVASLFISSRCFAGLTFVFNVDKQEGYVVRHNDPNNYLWIIIPSINMTYRGVTQATFTMERFREFMKQQPNPHFVGIIESHEPQGYEEKW